VVRLKGKKIVLIVSLAFVAMELFSVVRADPVVSISGYTEKPSYNPGQSGTVTLFVYNRGPEDIVLKNVTILYPWYSPVWGGNDTFANVNVTLSSGESWNGSKTFTIPFDSRAASGPIMVAAVYTVGTSTQIVEDDVLMSIVNPSDVSQSVDRLINYVTVAIALMVICTAIIATAIFLGASKLQSVWKMEQTA
jgi:hypothetical protein